MSEWSRIHEFSLNLFPVEAMKNIRGLLNLPHVWILSEGEGFLDLYQMVAGTMPFRGILGSDEHLAALLRQHDIKTFYSTDTDFKKFSWLHVCNLFL